MVPEIGRSIACIDVITAQALPSPLHFSRYTRTTKVLRGRDYTPFPRPSIHPRTRLACLRIVRFIDLEFLSSHSHLGTPNTIFTVCCLYSSPTLPVGGSDFPRKQSWTARRISTTSRHHPASSPINHGVYQYGEATRPARLGSERNSCGSGYDSDNGHKQRRRIDPHWIRLVSPQSAGNTYRAIHNV